MARKKKEPSSAAGQLLGYELQITRLAAVLLNAPTGAFCSVEVIDDVAQQAGKRTHSIQTKSAGSSNPVSNQAVPLWKTFAIWADQAARGVIDLDNASFEIYVSRPVSGDIVSLFDAAHTAESARSAIASAKAEIYGTPDSRRYPSDSLKPYVEKFFRASLDQRISIVKNFKLVCGSGSPIDDLFTIMDGHPVSKEKIVEIAAFLLGWIKIEVDKKLEQGELAIISQSDFNKVYTAQVQAVDRALMLSSITSVLDPGVVRATVSAKPNYIKQIELIELDFEDQVRAANDCLRAAADRTRWAQTGEIAEQSLVDLNESLSRTWINEGRRITLTHRDLRAADVGKLIFSSCMDHSHRLQSLETPPHFVPGCYHSLADLLEVGWHPNYRELMEIA